jgi:hypothetical protein
VKKVAKLHIKEVKHLHDCIVFKPILIKELLSVKKNVQWKVLFFLPKRKMEKSKLGPEQTEAHNMIIPIAKKQKVLWQ